MFSITDYRRITVEVDARHIIMRKFLARCGFQLEGILRKHRIHNRRNSDTALYALLNSEWQLVEIALKKHLGLPLKEPMKSAIAIDDLEFEQSSNGSKGSKKNGKMKKSKK